MVELKTLKDLAKTTILIPDLTKKHPCQEPTVPKEHIQEEELCQELGINWIKALKRRKGFVVGDVHTGEIFHKEENPAQTIKFIKVVFNISDEDLEEKKKGPGLGVIFE